MWRRHVVSVEPGGRDGGVRVSLGSGSPIHADLVVAALGVVPEVAWLAGAGLETAHGVVTDDDLRVRGAAGVYAAGDVALIGGGPTGGHWGHALAQGVHAARTIAYDLGLLKDSRAWVGSAAFTTRLYGSSIAALGAVTADSELVDLVDNPFDDLHVSAAASAGALDGIVVRGPLKIINRLRPLVAARAPVEDAVAVLGQFRSQQQRESIMSTITRPGNPGVPTRGCG